MKTHGVSKRLRSAAVRAVGGILLSMLCSSCALFGSPAPVVPFIPPGLGDFKADGIPFPDDTPGLLEAASRLCTPVTTREQKAAGYRLAQRALENLKPAPADQKKAAALALARCAYYYADFEVDPQKVLAVTRNGIESANAAGAAEKDPHASYYLGLNLGMHIRLVGLEAVGRVGEVLTALKAAAADKSLEQGGPLRVLGMIYLQAPVWPVGPGDPEAALPLLREAAERYPSHPLNHLYYAMALLENGDRRKAVEELEIAASLTRGCLWGDYAGRWLSEIRTLQSKLQRN